MVDVGKAVFTDEIEAIQKEVYKLKEKKASLIIGLGHVGFTKAKSILKTVTDMSIIINGGSKNTFLYNGMHFTYISRYNPLEMI